MRNRCMCADWTLFPACFPWRGQLTFIFVKDTRWFYCAPGSIWHHRAWYSIVRQMRPLPNARKQKTSSNNVFPKQSETRGRSLWRLWSKILVWNGKARNCSDQGGSDYWSMGWACRWTYRGTPSSLIISICISTFIRYPETDAFFLFAGVDAWHALIDAVFHL